MFGIVGLYQGGILPGMDGGHVLVTEVRGMAQTYFVLMCYGHSISSPLTDFTYKYQPGLDYVQYAT